MGNQLMIYLLIIENFNIGISASGSLLYATSQNLSRPPNYFPKLRLHQSHSFRLLHQYFLQ